MRDQFSRSLFQVAEAQPNVYIVVADISPAGSMQPFREKYPERFVNVGVAEQSMIGLCAGLALRGCTAFAYSIASFAIYRPFEQIRVDLCYQNLPVTVVGIGGGVGYSFLGGTHHTPEDVSILGSLPNMAILAPCDPLETDSATWACAARNGPNYLRLGKAGEPILTKDAPEPFVFGKARLIRPGSDVCILSYGPITKMAFDVASALEQTRGISTAVMSVHTLKPLDTERLIEVLHQYRMVAVIEEHSVRGGLAAQVTQLAWESLAPCKLKTFSLKDEFIHVYGSNADVLRAHGLAVEPIVASLCEKESRHGGNQPHGTLPSLQTTHRRAR